MSSTTTRRVPCDATSSCGEVEAVAAPPPAPAPAPPPPPPPAAWHEMQAHYNVSAANAGQCDSSEAHARWGGGDHARAGPVRVGAGSGGAVTKGPTRTAPPAQSRELRHSVREQRGLAGSCERAGLASLTHLQKRKRTLVLQFGFRLQHSADKAQRHRPALAHVDVPEARGELRCVGGWGWGWGAQGLSPS